MPIYEYVCTGCQARFEKMLPFSQSAAEHVCPDCGRPAKKAISLFASFSRAEDGSMSTIGGCPGCAGGGCACHAG